MPILLIVQSSGPFFIYVAPQRLNNLLLNLGWKKEEKIKKNCNICKRVIPSFRNKCPYCTKKTNPIEYHYQRY